MTNWTNSNDSWPSSSDDPASRYALEVVHGVRLAGQWVRRACERHLWDLKQSESGETDWLWRPELALKAIGLFRLFKHYKGEWAGQPMVLELWQCFAVGSLFGWVHRTTGLRRFRNAFWELCRGQGKSTMAGGIGIIFTFFDGEPGAEGYCFATKKDQAKIVFRTSRQMVLRSRAVKKTIGGIYRHNLHQEESESKLEPLGANEDTLDGLRPHIGIGDEIHKHASPDLVEVIESGMGTRRQPLLLLLTTAGEADGTETVYGQQLSISTQVLDGFDSGFDIPEWFAFIASADPKDDWELEETWIKANPNWGVSVQPDFIRKEYRKALANPAEQPKFRRLYLGQRVQSLDSYFSTIEWDQCPGLPDDDELRRYACWIGVDLSSSIDITAGIQVWRISADEIAIRELFWLPEDDLKERGKRDKVPYELWKEQGYLRLTPGNTIDRSTIRSDLVKIAQEWNVKGVCYDPWHAGEMVQAMQDEDKILMVPVPQRFAMLSQPTKDIQAMILRRRLRHESNPVMRWMIGNAKVREDDKKNVMLCKKRSRGKIDGAAALATAGNQVLALQKSTRSKYEDGTGLYSAGA